MLISDLGCAVCTLCLAFLYYNKILEIWHIYIANVLVFSVCCLSSNPHLSLLY